FLQQQPVRSGAPVVDEAVASHGHALRIHDRDARPVALEGVVLIAAAVRIHEMETVSEVSRARVAGDSAVVYELEIDAVAMPGDRVVFDHDASRGPQVNGVPRLRLARGRAADRVADDTAVRHAGQVDAEEPVLDAIPLDHAAVRLGHANGGTIFD